MRARRSFVLPLALAIAAAVPAFASPAAAPPDEPSGVRALRAASGATATLRLHPATGMARFIRLAPGHPVLEGTDVAARAADFLRRYGAALGVRHTDAEMIPARAWVDHLGFSHRRYLQTYRGLPVFAAELRLHFDPAGNLVIAQGTFLPDLDLDPSPARNAEEAAATAVALVREQVAPPPGVEANLTARDPRLLVFREGLLRGIPGPDRLAWEVEVGDGAAVRERVFVDAQTGKVLDRISGIETAIHRTVHSPQLNNVVIWDEGDPLPYSSGDPAGDAQVNTIINTSKSAYDLFKNVSGGTYLSYDGADAVMNNVWNVPPAGFCPNAAWDGTTTNYCYGVAGDDTVGHEWTHAYTEHTGGLIYQWQSGALNESFSDMYGELIDLLNGTGTDAPGGARSTGSCSTLGGSQPPVLTFNAPAALMGTVVGGRAQFNPAPPRTVTANVALANDGSGATVDACTTLIGFPAGSIALIDSGSCDSTVKVKNAQNAGAVAAIVVNTAATTAFTMTGIDGSIVIPSTTMGSADGDRVKAQLGAGVNATLTLSAPGDSSVRWLHAEDDGGFGGAIRDMWNPTCFADPGRVSDRSLYICSGASDGDGVHTNSGVPNHAFALLVDGGTYNGQTIAALGTTRVASLYWRAMSVYEVPDSAFGDHADGLETSCADLVGVNLPDPLTGLPSGLSLSAASCQEVHEAMLAVEMRDPPTFCNFKPLLDPATPPVSCGTVSFIEDFESNPTGRWSRSNSGVFAEWTPRNWEWSATPSAGGTGHAMFAIDSLFLGNCVPGSDDQSGVLYLDSASIPVRTDFPVLTFDHYVATEQGWDGGNLQISVNGGLFAPLNGADFRFNPYNLALQTPAAGNTDPLAGQPAFSGSNGGENQGSWGESQADLLNYAGEGTTVRLRFQFGSDGCNGLIGWYVDNVRICGDCSLGSGGNDIDGDGFRVCDADCNDADPATHPGAPEVNDGLDNQCPGEIGFGLADELSGTAGFFDALNPSLFSWPAQTGATQYQVARASARDFSTGCTTFLTASTSLTDSTIPPSGAAFYYLVRPLLPNAGSWGIQSSGASRSVPCAP